MSCVAHYTLCRLLDTYRQMKEEGHCPKLDIILLLLRGVSHDDSRYIHIHVCPLLSLYVLLILCIGFYSFWMIQSIVIPPLLTLQGHCLRIDTCVHTILLVIFPL